MSPQYPSHHQISEYGMMARLRRVIKGQLHRIHHTSSPPDVRERFEKFFTDRTDPWNYTSSYEQTKYERTLSLVPNGVETALEIGCAEGHFTVQLAPRVKALIASDIAETALQRAAHRCRGLAHVRFVQLDITKDAIPKNVDLIVCSEMLYFVGSVAMLHTVALKIAHALQVGGYLIMAHANLLVDEPAQTGFDWKLPFGAKVIGEVFDSTGLLRLKSEIRTPLYRIHLFQRVNRLQYLFSNHKSEVIVLNDCPTDLDPDVERQVHWAQPHNLPA